LQHDLGDPDRVGVSADLPGQIMAAVLFVPGKDSVSDIHAVII